MQILEVIRVFLLTQTKTLTLTGQSAAIKTADSGISSSQRASQSQSNRQLSELDENNLMQIIKKNSIFQAWISIQSRTRQFLSVFNMGKYKECCRLWYCLELNGNSITIITAIWRFYRMVTLDQAFGALYLFLAFSVSSHITNSMMLLKVDFSSYC
jgi:hypothetical protein